MVGIVYFIVRPYITMYAMMHIKEYRISSKVEAPDGKSVAYVGYRRFLLTDYAALHIEYPGGVSFSLFIDKKFYEPIWSTD
jgi:hypothetical protein